MSRLRMTAEGRTYYGFGEENRVVAAGRLKIGSIIGAPVDETRPDKLFFAGGGGSVRGYAYQSIGVVSPNGDVSGGRSLIEGSAELRARVTDTIGVVAFADAGYVGADRSRISRRSSRWASVQACAISPALVRSGWTRRFRWIRRRTTPPSPFTLE